MRLKMLRKEKGMTQFELAQEVGVSRSAIAMWELGANEPDAGMLVKLAILFGCTVDYLLEKTDERFDPDMIDTSDDDLGDLPASVHRLSALHRFRVPMIGEVAAGEPIYAPEDCEVFVDAPVKCDAAITIKGDSMYPNFLPGDVVYIRCVPDVAEGAVAVVFLDDEAVIKHVYKRKTGLTLWSDNPEYLPMQIEFEDYSRVRIFGVPVGFTRMFKKDAMSKLKHGFH